MRMFLLLPAVFAAFTLVLSSAASRSAEPSPPKAPSTASEFFPQPTEREARLDAALDQRLSIAFQEMPLKDVAAWFGSKLEVPMILDNRALEDAGVGDDTPVTRTVDGIRARAALKLVLDDLDLTSLQQDGVLMITTKDVAETELFTRVYPVGDLTPLVPRPVEHARKGGMRPSHGHGMFQVAEDAQNPPPAGGSAEQSKQPPAKVETQMIADYGSLIEVITTTVRPKTWDEVGGPGAISQMSAAQSIVVSQTREVHDEILELLRALRAAKLAGAVAPAEK